MDGLCGCGCGQATKVATRSDSRKGWVKGQPFGHVFGHQSKPRPTVVTEDPAARFGRYCKADESGCILFTGKLNWGGYGKFWVEGRTIAAHRYAYELARGPIPDGLTIDHLCRVRHCVNAEHMEPVSIQENLSRALDRPEQRTHCPQGHPYAGANLSLISNKGSIERRCKACANQRARERRRAG